MKLTVATCQFPISSNILRNCEFVLQQLQISKTQCADVVHFPEACLSGYVSADFPSYKDFKWKQLKQSTLRIIDKANQLNLWVILGSTHQLTGRHKPHNSLYIINNHGKFIDRYDKMFCAGDKDSKTGDLAHYSPGDHFVLFTIKGVRCGTLICHEYRYPELYRQYKLLGAQLIFHSYHAGHLSPKRFQKLKADVGLEPQRFNPGSTLPGITMPATMIASAANNYVWISCSNTSARQSCWSSFFVRPDGVVTGRLRRNTAGVLLTTVDTNRKYYDSTVAWRDRAIKSVFHSGILVKDSRSKDRTHL